MSNDEQVMSDPVSADGFAFILLGESFQAIEYGTKLIKQRDTALLAPHLAKIKELEDECKLALNSKMGIIRNLEEQLAKAERRIELLENNLRWVLPMARGYAEENKFKTNERIIKGAYKALSDTAGSEGNKS